MYLTRFHKSILKEIWKSRNTASNKDFDLDSFMKYYYTWYKKKHGKSIFKIENRKRTDCIYSGHLLAPDNQYIIKTKHIREVILALREYDTILKYLNANNLINVVEKRSKEKHPHCIPLLVHDNSNNNGYEPFTDGLNCVVEYLGKEIQVREGYRKFKRFNYLSHDELTQIIIGIWLPLLAIIITILVEIFSE